jgi:uncharacterized damage-inducible protein DinB
MGAEVSWLDRMTVGKDPEDWEVWENADAAWLRTAWREVLGARWSAFLANAELCNPARNFTYVDFLGETRKARVEDAITGLMLHSSHHRGQVASVVRAAGGTPAVTDFLHAVRGGALA